MVTLVHIEEVLVAGGGGSGVPHSLGLTGTPETITVSGSNQATTLTLAGSAGAVTMWRVAIMGTDHCYVAFGVTPNATTAGSSATSSRHGCPAGGVYEFAGVVGDKAAVVIAS